MKRIIALFLLLTMALTFSSCGSKPDEITCEDVIKVYEDAGYYVKHSQHHEDDYYCICTISIRKSEADYEGDHIYFAFFRTAKEAKADAKQTKYNIVKWIFALAFGEARWLKSKTYGKISYSYYNSDMVKPFKTLIK